MNWTQEKYSSALEFAALAHRGQAWPGTALPYLIHPCLVAMELTAALGPDAELDGDLAIQCGLLHDTLEDTHVTFEEIVTRFGGPVARGVAALTKNRSLPRPEQMRNSLERILAQPREIWMVKMADRIANLRQSPPGWNREKIDEYLDESKMIYETLKSGSAPLASRLCMRINAYGTTR